jgi:hypothetical protein
MLKHRAQTTNPKLENHKELPLQTRKPLQETEQLQQLSSDRSDWSPSPVRLVDKIAQHHGTTPVRLVPFTGQADATF